ncbi:unnamed protein product [Hymenolepis diminuta]|uniref:SLC41A/MgtE integral membrane domain-containing protein n=1 Tax=Hymenolepis diminuta TaxID=6216 RepID=A0A564YGT9_HYMDI|nr:unnamed protein product [Hymenolepis diminuta]
MISPLIGLKGNIEMTFSSRISAIANTFTDEMGSVLCHLIASNFILSFVLAVTGGAVVAACGLLLKSSAFQLKEAFISFSVAIISSSLAVIFIGVCMLIVVYLCVKYSIDPDNVAAPLAAALGDFFVLLIMILVVWTIESFFESPFPAYLGMSCCVVFAFGPALSYLRGSKSENCLAADYITLIHCLVPLLTAVLLSSVSGWILASYVNLLPSLPRLQPPINGVGGNLASILISRMTTRLSIVSKPMITENIVNQINAATPFSCFHSVGKEHSSPEGSVTRSDSDEDGTLERSRPVGSLKATEMAVTQAISDSNTSTCGLLTLCLPLHSMLLVINYIVSSLFHESSGSNAFSISVILAYLAAGFLQVFVLLLFARMLVLRRWLSLARHQQQQVSANTRVSAGGLAALDLTGIAVTTGLGDFVGTAFLATFLRFAESS